MINRRFAAVAVVAASLAALCVVLPIHRYLSKVDTELAGRSRELFRSEALPSAALGVAVVLGAVYLATSRPRIGWLLVLAAPLVAWLAQLIIWLVP